MLLAGFPASSFFMCDAPVADLLVRGSSSGFLAIAGG